MLVMISNYGNDSIALIEWAHQHALKNLTILDIDTKWAAPEWQLRVSNGQKWAKSLGFNTVTLQPKTGFAELVRTRGNFPSRKFQWCAGFLKGLPINAWLTKFDPKREAIILIARRRAASRAQMNLPEFIEECEHFDDRKLWHPLYLHSHLERDNLITRTNFSVLTHRSLECDPCVNSDFTDVLRMSNEVITKTALLEQEMHSKMLDPALYDDEQNLKTAGAIAQSQIQPCRNSYELFDMGCGSVFGCGL